MSMKLRQKEVVLDSSGTKKIVVVEAGWDYTFRFSEIEKELTSVLADPELDETLRFFCRNFYPLMASCSEGEVPSAQEAFALPRLYLDNWYWTFWELNEDIVGEPCPKTMEHEEIEFRDGSKVVVWQSNGIPSFILKLIELEAYAVKNPLVDDEQGQLFCALYYPKMAAACNGSSDVPDAITVRNWPRSEINKWLEASRRLNPGWYAAPEEQKQEAAQQERKKPRRRSAG